MTFRFLRRKTRTLPERARLSEVSPLQSEIAFTRRADGEWVAVDGRNGKTIGGPFDHYDEFVEWRDRTHPL